MDRRFLLANTWEGKLPVQDFLVEWKWDGIRCMAIKRNNQVFLWSRGEEIITHQFPEIEKALMNLSDGMWYRLLISMATPFLTAA